MARKAFQESIRDFYEVNVEVKENDGDGDFFVCTLTIRDGQQEVVQLWLSDTQAQALASNLNVARNLYHNRQDAKIPKCKVCRGSGSVEMDDFYGPSYYAQCSACKGTGKA